MYKSLILILLIYTFSSHSCETSQRKRKNDITETIQSKRLKQYSEKQLSLYCKTLFRHSRTLQDMHENTSQEIGIEEIKETFKKEEFDLNDLEKLHNIFKAPLKTLRRLNNRELLDLVKTVNFFNINSKKLKLDDLVKFIYLKNQNIYEKILPDIKQDFEENNINLIIGSKYKFMKIKEIECKYAEISSDNNKLITTSSDDDTVKIWDINTGQSLRTLAHGERLWHAKISADNRLVVTASDNSAKIWDIDTGQCLHTLNHNGRVRHAEISTDNRFIVTTSHYCAKIWDANSGQCLHTLKHTDWVYHATISPDNKFVVTSSYDQTAKIWDANSGQCLHTLTHTHWVYHATISPNNRFVVTTSHDRTAKIWDVNNGQCIRSLPHNYTIREATVSADNKYIITAPIFGLPMVWNINSGKCRRTLRRSYWTDQIVSPNNKILITSGNNAIKVWNMQSGKVIDTLREIGACCAAVSPDSKFIVTRKGWWKLVKPSKELKALLR